MSHVPVGAKGAGKDAAKGAWGRLAEPTNAADAADADLLVRTGLRAGLLHHCGCGCHRVMCDW
ncbi:hypothetical protein AB0945_33995 [Streptomyces sp. NPDC005474]|uniref:hypothetical protein n=1 Tax=Streptomyces sp. NPDC005474 TaxID=3154878 RepID=UPI0034552704